jgi:hypothetical protein
MRVVALVFSIAVAGPVTAQDRSSPPNQKAQPPAIPPDWDTFSADVTMRQDRVSADRTLTHAPMESRFRFERTRSAAGWKTAITVLSGVPLNAAPGMEGIRSKAPHVGMRIEDPGDGSGIRMVDAAGKELRLPQHDQLRSLPGRSGLTPFASPLAAESLAAGIGIGRADPGRDWADALVIQRGQHGSRAHSFEQLHGKPIDRTKGLDRYITSSQDSDSEILVDPESALPVEINIVRDGTLVSHVTHEYVPYGPQHLLRKRVRVERRVPGSRVERTLVVFELDNVCFERHGGGE